MLNIRLVSVRVLVQIPGGYQMMITDIQIPVPTHRAQTDHRPGPGQLNSAIKILAAHIVSPAQPSPGCSISVYIRYNVPRYQITALSWHEHIEKPGFPICRPISTFQSLKSVNHLWCKWKSFLPSLCIHNMLTRAAVARVQRGP